METKEDKRFAVMSKKQGDLELRILENKKESDEYYKYLKGNNIPIELSAEIPTSKTPRQITSEIKKYLNNPRIFSAYSKERNGYSSLLYLDGDSIDNYEIKEAFNHYLTKFTN
ncbi:MAG TPA: hypothetical protein VJ912_03330 [Candidatus Nanoarchaeia archaeon]|nr:hypothetical protein [Candidatus Nanoarchaeia archaeon]